jgi:hypothetical protein
MPTSVPAAVAARLDRFAATRARSSLLSASAATGLRTVGFETVGDVMGCTAFALSRRYPGGCGNGPGKTPVVRLGGYRWSGFEAYLAGLRKGYATALGRLNDEAAALGADGVVGVQMSVTEVAVGNSEEVYGWLRHDFVALGTAVRGRTQARPAEPFTTSLSGPDVATLMLAGWVPVAFQVVIDIGSRHNDWATLLQARPGRVNRDNVEVVGYTQVEQAVRASARRKLRTRIVAAGADGGLLRSIATTHWHSSCGSSSDHVVQAVATGDAIARFGAPSRTGPAPLAVLPLRTGGVR